MASAAAADANSAIADDSGAAANASLLKSPGSAAFSSQPAATVVTSSHVRRASPDASGTVVTRSGNAGDSDMGSSSANDNNSSESNDNNNRNNQSSGSSRGAAHRNASPPSPYSSGSDQSETSLDEEFEHSSSTDKTASITNSSSGGNGSSSSASRAQSSGATLPEPIGQQQQQQQQRSHSSGLSSDPNVPSTGSLPSISGAALLQLRGAGSGSSQTTDHVSSIQPTDKRGDESLYSATSSYRHYRCSRSRSRERVAPNNSNNTMRWSASTMDVTRAANESSDAMPAARLEDPTTGMSGPVDDREVRVLFHGREVRVLFHGREVFADDLIGLRVSKTFAGHGRFLGQVVKFDQPSLLYTVVYADGDAEELSIESTIQILIQDEIERADPSLAPVAVAYALRSESPSSGNTRPQALQTQQQQQQQPPMRGQVPAPARSTYPAAPSHSHSADVNTRVPVQISEREAQFVVGLFENHALPVLLRDGWKVRASASGAEQRFYSPPSAFAGAGRVFTSALGVVELIASDSELLDACFPPNVHAAILSLFPDSVRSSRERSRERNSSGGRKRMAIAAPLPNEPELYDMKRPRAGRGGDDLRDAAPTSHMRPVASSHSYAQPHGGMGEPLSGAYRSADMVMEHDAYGPSGLPERYSSVSGGVASPPRNNSRGGNSGVRPSRYSDAGDYRRVPTDARSVPMRVSPSMTSHWPGHSSGSGGGVRASLTPHGSDIGDYRRQYVADSPEWRERDVAAPRGGGSGGGPQYLSEPPLASYHEDPYRSHTRPDAPPSPYYSDLTVSHSSMHGAMGMNSESRRYHDARGSPGRHSPSAEHFYHHSSTGRGPPLAPSADALTRQREPPLQEYCSSSNSNAGLSDRGSGRPLAPSGRDPSSGLAPQSMPASSSRGPSFSMSDVDRNAHPRGSIGSAPSPVEQQRDARRPVVERSAYELSERSRSPHVPDTALAYNSSSGHSQQSRRHHHHTQSQSQSQPPPHLHQRMSSNGDNYNDASGVTHGSGDLIDPRGSTASPSAGAPSNQ